MKVFCIFLLCMATLVSGYVFEGDADTKIRRTSKNLEGGYIFVTTPIGGGKYDCECYKKGRRVWAGMCGVRDKSFAYDNCA